MMKRLFLFLGSFLFAFSMTAQETMTLAENSWESDGETFTNSQGSIALTPSMDIVSGYKVTVTFEGSSSGEDIDLSAVVVDNSGEWTVLSSWESVTIASGSFTKTISFSATAAVGTPTLVLSTPAGTMYNETLTFSNLECVVTDPSYRDPNVTIDSETLSLSDLNCSWGSSSYDAATQTITFDGEWTGQGWAWWGTGLDITEYKSVTVEFEATDCQVSLFAQKLIAENETLDGNIVVEAGETSVTLDFVEMFEPFPQDIIHQLCLQRETAGILVLKAAYLTYADEETGVDDVEKNVQISGGIVYSAGLISVYNVAGQKVAESILEYNLASLPQGVYIIKTAEGIVKMLK